jgi:hypothetical protein
MILCVYSQDLIRLRKLNDSRRLWVGNHQDSSDGRSFEKAQVRDLIRRMSFENPAVGRSQDPWRVAQARHRGRPVHGFDLHGVAARSAIADVETFLCNHMEGIASIDLFVVPTIAFEQLFAFLVLGHRRRTSSCRYRFRSRQWQC